MGGECLICDRIAMIRNKTNPHFVAELETGFVVIGDHQYFHGYTLFLCKEHVTELHLCRKEFKEAFLIEMSLVSEAVYHCFQPDKLNYELLGNGDAHMHWHLFPRRRDEARPNGPVWWTDRSVMYSEEVRPDETELRAMKSKLYHELAKVAKHKIISAGVE